MAIATEQGEEKNKIIHRLVEQKVSIAVLLKLTITRLRDG